MIGGFPASSHLPGVLTLDNPAPASDESRPTGDQSASRSDGPSDGGPDGGERSRGLRDQFKVTREAAIRLVRAHLELAQAEFAEILERVRRIAVFVGLAVALLFFVGVFAPIGAMLFLGEWLFGSIGWGVLLGMELSVALAVTLILAALGSSGGDLGRPFLVAVVLGVAVGFLLGLDVANEGWRRLGEEIAPTLAPDSRPLVVATAILAGLGGILGLVAGVRSGGLGGTIGGLVFGAILGALVGAFSAVTFGRQVGAAIGVAVGLLVWPLMAAIVLFRRGIDVERLKESFWPSQTIETTKETIEWVREQTPLGRKS